MRFREKIKNINHYFQLVNVPINFTSVDERIILWNKLSTKAAAFNSHHIVIQESLSVEGQPHAPLVFPMIHRWGAGRALSHDALGLGGSEVG